MMLKGVCPSAKRRNCPDFPPPLQSRHKTTRVPPLHNHGKIKSKSCENHQEDFICLKSAQFFQQNQVIPDFIADNLTCPDSYPEVPGNIQMVLFPEQPELMCPGEKVKYECNSGGINVRQVSIITSSLEYG